MKKTAAKKKKSARPAGASTHPRARGVSPARKKDRRPRSPAGPAPAPGAPSADPSRPRALDIARAGLDKKAEDVLVLDVRGLSSYADYFVLMTADSDRQAGAIADAVEDKLKEQNSRPIGVEGYESGRWILIDCGDVVAHVFGREARGFYDLEGLWADAPRFQVEG
ncbi:MAG TPA: ribosome silencing factor [Anaeromyxobacteraceae bacterium]|nr:ribosome silencing factor [Anaeromyxobacteraceae bacterium]